MEKESRTLTHPILLQNTSIMNADYMTTPSTDYLYSFIVQTESSSSISPQTHNHSANNEQEIHDQTHNVPIEIGLDLQSLLDSSFINYDFNNEIYFNNNQLVSQFINIESSIASSCTTTSTIHGANNNVNNNNVNICNPLGQYELNDHSLELILNDVIKCDLKDQLNSNGNLPFGNQIEFAEPEVSFNLLDSPLAELTHSDLSQFIVLPNNHHQEQRAPINDLAYSETCLNHSSSSNETSFLKQESANEFDDELTSYSSPFSNQSTNTENNSLVLIDQSFRIQSPSSLDSQHSFSVSSFYDLLNKPNSSSDLSTSSLLNASFNSQNESKACLSRKKKSETNTNTKLDKVSKKESNKAAAIRYRTKKLKEKEQLFAECELYSKKNNELRSKIDDLQTRISCIKSLLVEALIKKNSN